MWDLNNQLKWTANCQGSIGTGLFPNPNKYETTTITMVQRMIEHFKLIYWESNSDYFTYIVQILVTKRYILIGLAIQSDHYSSLIRLSENSVGIALQFYFHTYN